MRRLMLVLFPAILLSGCFVDIGDVEGDRYQEDFHFTKKLNPGGRVTLSGFNGKVEVSTWEKNEIDVSGTKFASSESRLKNIVVDVSEVGGVVTVRASSGSGRNRGGVRFMIRVPKKCELERIETSNGGIRVDGVEGERINLSTHNGTVNVLNTQGALAVETHNGSIEVAGHTGDARFKTSNGRVEAEIRDGSADAQSSNGKVGLRFTGKVSSKPIRAETNNGSIDIELDAARDVRAKTSNSSIQVRLPRDANAEVRAYTSNSNISSDFEVAGMSGSSTSSSSRHRLDGKIGQGGPLLDLETSNGSIRLRSR